MIELRARTRVSDAELAGKLGKVVGPADYNAVLTGPARILDPAGRTLAVYLPGVLADLMDEAWPILTTLRAYTDNRGLASGTPRVQRGDQKRSRTRRIISMTLGAVDPGPAVTRTGGRLNACRLTAWTGSHVPEWQQLAPLFQAIAGHLAEQVPDRYVAQATMAKRTPPEWLIPGTPFTTVTVNNSYATGVHTDAGDYEPGFSTLAVCRRGAYTGGLLVLARYRLAVDMGHGDLLLFDAHTEHGNTDLVCPHVPVPLNGAVPAERCNDGCERISLVAYFRTKVADCPDAATAAQAHAELVADRTARPLNPG